MEQGDALTDAILADYQSAPISEQMKAMLAFLEKLTLHPELIQLEDVAPLHAAGISEEAMLTAVYVSVLFQVYNRMADALNFALPPRKSFDISAKMLLNRGYL